MIVVINFLLCISDVRVLQFLAGKCVFDHAFSSAACDSLRKECVCHHCTILRECVCVWVSVEVENKELAII